MAASGQATTAGPANRRERLRAWTLAEIKAEAMRQLAEHGVEGLSLNAIAKQLGMTGPAIYRYVASRDELLAELVAEAWEDVAEAFERAAQDNADAPAARRLGAIGHAYRAWAIADPHRYRLALQTREGSGELAADRVIPAATRAMTVILDAVASLPASRRPKSKPPSALTPQLSDWATRTVGKRYSATVLLRGITFWSRTHGLISLELDHHLASMQLDPELLYAAELEELGADA
jgi:AcrR family transcriptional regulator